MMTLFCNVLSTLIQLIPTSAHYHVTHWQTLRHGSNISSTSVVFCPVYLISTCLKMCMAQCATLVIIKLVLVVLEEVLQRRPSLPISSSNLYTHWPTNISSHWRYSCSPHGWIHVLIHPQLQKVTQIQKKTPLNVCHKTTSCPCWIHIDLPRFSS